MSEEPALDRFEECWHHLEDRMSDEQPGADSPGTTPPPLWNIAQVAARLAVTVRHVRRLVSERRIPFIRWGYHLRFDPIEIEAWIDRGRHSCS